MIVYYKDVYYCHVVKLAFSNNYTNSNFQRNLFTKAIKKNREKISDSLIKDSTHTRSQILSNLSHYLHQKNEKKKIQSDFQPLQ
jgi:hypothetical protein